MSVLRFGSTLALVLALATTACGPVTPQAASSPAKGALTAATSGAKYAALHDGMRRLWEDHITWTRLYIVSAVAGLPDATPTATRLLQNQTDIGTAVKPYYGDAAGNALTGLLKEHIGIAVDIIVAAKGGDTAKFEAANKKWYANMDDISALLSSANPKSWPLAQLRPMMRMHLDLTLVEASARLHGDWAADVVAYDQVHTHILQLADELTNGIVTQFPEKFSD
jgi:hypothetical protein